MPSGFRRTAADLRSLDRSSLPQLPGLISKKDINLPASVIDLLPVEIECYKSFLVCLFDFLSFPTSHPLTY